VNTISKKHTLATLIFLSIGINMLFAVTRPVAVLNKVVGEVKIDMVLEPGWQAASLGGKLANGDKLETGSASFSSIMFLDRSMIKVRENTKFTVKSKRTVKRELETDINVAVGEMNVKTTTGSKFKIQTPTSVASVKGTEFNLMVEKDGTTHLTVLEGTVEFMNELGVILATEMTSSVSRAGVSPSNPISVPKKAVPSWQKKTKEAWKLKLSPDKPGGKDIGKPFNIKINAKDSGGNNALDYSEEVTISAKDGIQVSGDGGQSWSSEVSVKLNKGKGVLKAKGIEIGKRVVVVTGENSSPGKLVVNMKRSKEAMNKINSKASKALGKIAPNLANKISGKTLKGSSISKGSGNTEDVFDQLLNGLMQLSGEPQVVENPDGSVKVIMKVKPSEGNGD
jgi:hypothetical protein